MHLLPFVATILMVAHRGNATGEKEQVEILKSKTIPILAVFGTKILGGVKKYCEKVDEEGIVVSIICGSANALNEKFKIFGESIQEKMHLGKLITKDEGRTVSQSYITRTVY
jgi:hypothetical protein